jgi:hypothetical protein
MGSPGLSVGRGLIAAALAALVVGCADSSARSAASSVAATAAPVADRTDSTDSAVTATASDEALPADRLTTWDPGIPGGVPARAATCSRLSAASYGNGSNDAAAAIQGAINACPAGQVVQLGAGVFRIDAGFLLINRGVTLRGAGAGSTVLRRTNGAHAGTYVPGVQDPVVIIGPNRWPKPDSSSPNLTADAAKGARAVTLSSTAGLSPGVIVLVDEDHYTTAEWKPLPSRGGAPTSVRIFASDRIVWQRHDPPSGEDDPFPQAASWFSRPGRVISEMKEVASVNGRTVTFTTPLHIGYRVSHHAQLTPYTGANAHVKGAGIEDLTVEGGGDGNVRFEAAAGCWMRNVESTGWLGEGVAIDQSFRVEVRDSYVHDGVWPEPGGGGYAISLAIGSSEVLIENNIVLKANKVMVARAAGAGSVVGYNYMDDGFIQSNPEWVEVGINGSHLAGSHHMLFEGNESFNYDADNTHGGSIYHTVFRNHLTGFRRSFPGMGNARAAGLMYGSWWHTFAGNVLGTAGRMEGWRYEDPGDGSLGHAWGDGPFIWKLGYDPIHWDQAADPLVQSTVVREGNFDYLTGEVRWTNGPKTLPPSLYLREKPAFFGSLPWPWVDPTSPDKLATLPARARFDSGATAVPLVPAAAKKATPKP